MLLSATACLIFARPAFAFYVSTNNETIDLTTYPGVDPTGIIECSAAITAALQDISTLSHVLTARLPAGTYLIDPARGIGIPDLVSLVGDGEDATEIIPSNIGPGSLIRRAVYNPLSSANPISQRQRFANFRVVVTGPQTGLDLRHLSRTWASGVYVSKARLRENLTDWTYVPGSIGIRAGTGNSAGAQPGYAWGDAATIQQCRIYGAEFSIELSAGHAHRVVSCDLAHGDLLINVPDTASSGIVIRDNIMQYCLGRWALDFNGNGGLIHGNYFENPQVTMSQVLLRSGSTATVCRASENYFYPPNMRKIINEGIGNTV